MIVLELPRPPSTNKLYRNPTEKESRRAWANGKHPPQRIKTQRYDDWISAAGWDVNAARQKPIGGEVRMTLDVGRDINKDGKPSRRKIDCSNFLKATEDLMVRQRLIDDDCYVQGHEINFVTDVDPRRIRVTIQSARERDVA